MPAAGVGEKLKGRGSSLPLITKLLSRAAGRVARLPLPRLLRPILWQGVARVLGVRLEEVPRPLSRYPHFSAFFTRPLPPELLHFPQDSTLLSPVSGVFLERFSIQGELVLPVKGNPHPLKELLGGEEAGKRFLGGEGYTLYLRPRDYHRIHAFDDLLIKSVQLFPGGLMPVHRLGQKVPGIFVRNERWLLLGEHRSSPFAMIWVGALFVGSLRFLHPALVPFTPTLAHPLQRGAVSVRKGEELGCFEFGSTVILILARRCSPLLPVGAEIRACAPFLKPLEPWEAP